MIKNVFLILAMSFCAVGISSKGLAGSFMDYQGDEYSNANVNGTDASSPSADTPGSAYADEFNKAAQSNEALEAQDAECKATIAEMEEAKKECGEALKKAQDSCTDRRKYMEGKQKNAFNDMVKNFSAKYSSCDDLKKSNQKLSDESAKSYVDYCTKGSSACKDEKDCPPNDGYDKCAVKCAAIYNKFVDSKSKCSSGDGEKAWSAAFNELDEMSSKKNGKSCHGLSDKINEDSANLKAGFDATNTANDTTNCSKSGQANDDSGPSDPIAKNPNSGDAKSSGGGGNGGGGDTGGGSGGGQQNAEQKKSGGGDPFSQLLSGLMGMMNQQGGGDTSGQVATAVDPCNGDALCKCMMMGGDARSCSQNSQQAPTVTAFSNPLANVGGAKMTNGTVDDTPPAIPNGQMQLPEFKNQEQPGGQPGAGMYTGGGGGMGGGSGNFKPDPPAGKARSSLSADILSGTQKGGSSAGAASLNSRSFSSSSPREPSSSDRPENKPITPDLKQFMPTIQPNDLKVSGMEPTAAKDGRLGQDFVSYCISISQCGSSDSNLWGNSRRAVDTLREKYSDNFED